MESSKPDFSKCMIQTVADSIAELHEGGALCLLVPLDVFDPVMTWLSAEVLRARTGPGQAYGAGAWFDFPGKRKVLVAWPTRPTGHLQIVGAGKWAERVRSSALPNCSDPTCAICQFVGALWQLAGESEVGVCGGS